MGEGFPFSTSLPIPAVSCVVDFSHCDRCEVESHCGFDFYCSDDEWCWASLLLSVGHLYVCFGKMSFHVSWFFNWFVNFGFEFYKFFIEFENSPLSRYVICRYLLLIHKLPVHFVDYSLCCAAEPFVFMKSREFLFPFVSLVSEIYLVRSCYGQGQRGYSLCYLLGFSWLPVSCSDLSSVLNLFLCMV